MKRLEDFKPVAGPAGNRLVSFPEPELAVGDEVELGGRLAEIRLHDIEMNRVHNGKVPRKTRMSVSGPFYYLGHGREKVVLSAMSRNKRVALGLPIDENLEGTLTPHLAAFRMTYRGGCPTYDWYAQADDFSIVVMPDLSQEHRVCGINQSAFLPRDAETIEGHWLQIRRQMDEIIEKTLSVRKPFTLPHDVYFLLLRDEAIPRVFCGDFDIYGFDNTLGLEDTRRHNKEAAGSVMFEIKKRVKASLKDSVSYNAGSCGRFFCA